MTSLYCDQNEQRRSSNAIVDKVSPCQSCLFPKTRKESALQMPEILVISGDIGLSHFLTEGLLLEGFWTSSVAGGFQALEVFRLRQFDLVLLDATIGDIGPAELVRRLRSAPIGVRRRSNIPAPLPQS